LAEQLTYGTYLALDDLLGAQHLRSEPPHHDELLFIIQHQTSELWLKLMLHELRSAREAIRNDDLNLALKRTARSVLATLTPSEYVQFREFLATSSGFQSYQYRAVEFLLGNKNASMLDVFKSDPAAQALLTELLHEPSLYDEFLALLARAGFAIPASALNTDVTKEHEFNEELVPALLEIYTGSTEHWRYYEACEELVDLEENFQLWRFRHLRTVQRTIGMKTGTGGSAGVAFLERALSHSFFPELYAVRNQIGA
jgi:tryptophan 2,3-dioxygenase